MVGEDHNLKRNSALQVVFNYWENRPSSQSETSWSDSRAHLSGRLDDLIKRGVTHLATFLPWQVVESDISHALTRFLQAATERRMSVTLIVTPEVGVHLPCSGLPKEFFAKADFESRTEGGNPHLIFQAPQVYKVPSLLAPEVQKKFTVFLTRVDNLLTGFERQLSSGSQSARISVALSGSFWKYYRDPAIAAHLSFGGMNGDFSPAAQLLYRKHLDLFFAQREYLGVQFKAPTLEDTNRKVFFQLSEDASRNRVAQLVRKRSLPTRMAGEVQTSEMIQTTDIELFTPEADPALTYANTHSTLYGLPGDFERYSSYIDDASLRHTTAAQIPTRPYVHWTSFGGFRSLSDSERQLLVLKSLVLFASRGGGVFIDEQEWLQFSAPYRTRLLQLTESFERGDLRSIPRAAYLVPHLWSSSDVLGEELEARFSGEMIYGAHLKSFLRPEYMDRLKVIAVDPGMILTRDLANALLKWANEPKNQRILVLPRSRLMTEGARQEIEAFSRMPTRRKLEVNHGVRYDVFGSAKETDAFDENGVVLWYEVPDRGLLTELGYEAVSRFAMSIASLAEIEPLVRLSDGRLSQICLDLSRSQSSTLSGPLAQGGGRALFLFNPYAKPVSVTVKFKEPVLAQDLAQVLRLRGGASLPTSDLEAIEIESADLEVPACGVLSLALQGGTLGLEKEIEFERLEARAQSAQLMRNVDLVAQEQLPGLYGGASGVE